jgi:GDP-4-dehydro-6-deoxy-D-mannose reductase
VSSSQVYGEGLNGFNRISETSFVSPTSAYGFSKLAAEATAQMFRGPKLSVYIARPFNHIGPGQSPSFACAGFAARVVTTLNGSRIKVGNLSAKRDFTDVRDIVRAYRLIIEQSPQKHIFILGSGRTVELSTVLQSFIRLSGKSIVTETDTDLFRPDEVFEIVADFSNALGTLNWKPEISFEQTVQEIYEDALKRAASLRL